MKTTIRLVASCTLLGLLAACGSKDKPAETAATETAATETASTTTQVATTTETPAPTTEAAAPAAAADATFDINSVPVTSADLGSFPYLSGLQTYEVSTSNSEDYDFEMAYVYDGKNLVPIEGKVSQRYFRPKNGEKQASELMIHRNYENLLKTLGATKVSDGKPAKESIDKIGYDKIYKHGKWSISSDHETDTYVIRQKDKEVWVQVTALGSDANYNLTVTERAAMPQQAGIIKADELKKN